MYMSSQNTNDISFNPVSFAEWRLKEFKKPQSAGVLNESLEIISSIFREMIGDFENKRKPSLVESDKSLSKEWLEYGTKLWSGDNYLNKFFAFWFFLFGGILLIIYYGLKVPLFIITLILKLLGLTKTFSAPIIIYGVLVGLSFSQKHIYDPYRMMWLLITYILLYTRNFNIKLFTIFIVLTIIIETYLIFLGTYLTFLETYLTFPNPIELLNHLLFEVSKHLFTLPTPSF